MTTLAKLDAAINNAELNAKPEVAAALRMFRDGVAELEASARALKIAVEALNSCHIQLPDGCDTAWDALAAIARELQP